MDRVNLSEVRDRLNDINLELADSHLTSREIVGEFRKRQGELINHASDEIVDVGLIQLLNQVSNRRPSAVAPGQGDLFAGYNDFPVVVVVPATGADGRRRDERKKFVDMSYAEALEWLEAHLRRREDDDEKLIDARRIIDRAAPISRMTRRRPLRMALWLHLRWTSESGGLRLRPSCN